MRMNVFGLLLISLCFRADLFLSLPLRDKKRKGLKHTKASACGCMFSQRDAGKAVQRKT